MERANQRDLVPGNLFNLEQRALFLRVERPALTPPCKICAAKKGCISLYFYECSKAPDIVDFPSTYLKRLERRRDA